MITDSAPPPLKPDKMSLTSQQPPSLITLCNRKRITILHSSTTTDDSHLVALMTGIHDPQSMPGDAAHSISHGSINVATGHQENGTQQSYSGLQRSLRGIPLSRGVQYHALFPSYPDQFWPDEDKAMGIPNNSVERDIKRITKWSGQFSRRTLKVYRDCAANAPNAENLRKLLWEPRASPTFIYASGHTDCVEGNSAYLPSDCIEGGKYHPNRVVPYTEFQDKLTLRHHRAPVILVTDVCNCDNFLKLPYVYEYSYEDGKAICTETGYNTNSDRSAPILVHFAATLPGQSATFFPEFGSVYNSAVNAIVLAEKLSLGGIVEKVQIQMDKHLNNRLPQKHRVYSSHKFDGEDFFGTLGFSSKKHPSSQRSSTGNQ